MTVGRQQVSGTEHVSVCPSSIDHGRRLRGNRAVRGFDELDAIGPYEVLENGAQAGASIETDLVTLEETDLVTASHDLRVEPDGTLGDPDLLIVPGGGWTTANEGVRAVVEDGVLPDAVERFTAGATVASVCTGR